MCAAEFQQWLHEYCPLKRELPLACRRNTYLRRYPTDNSPTVSIRSTELAKRHHAIFKNKAQNIECSSGCVARSAVLLKPNVVNILLFNFCEQKLVQYGPITIAIDFNGLSFFIFQEKWPNYASGPTSASNSDSFWGASAFQCMRAAFLCPKGYNFACLHTRQDQNKLHLIFLPKLASSGRRSQAHLAKPCSSVHTTIFVRRKDKTNYLSNQT